MSCRLLILFVICVLCRVEAALQEEMIFQGMCDASAAVVVNDDLFVVADDEDNILRFYRTSQLGPPAYTNDLAPVLGLKRKAELDLEAACRLGTNTFWITSHGQNKDGEFAPNRHRFFALTISGGPDGPDVQLVGKPFTELVSAMAADSRLSRFELEKAAGHAPKQPGGLSIEALTDTPEGTLLIGFRNPIPEGRALIVPLLNPSEVLTGIAPRFGEPVLLDLQGLGLRGMESTDRGYYLIGGPANGDGESRLFFWDGRASAPTLVPGVSFQGFNPEAIAFNESAEGGRFLILSDDGGVDVDGVECKDLPASRRHFRGRWMVK